jgi:hypothetical protein
VANKALHVYKRTKSMDKPTLFEKKIRKTQQPLNSTFFFNNNPEDELILFLFGIILL